MGPLHLHNQICGHVVVCNIPLLSFVVYRISSDGQFFVSGISGFYLSFS